MPLNRPIAAIVLFPSEGYDLEGLLASIAVTLFREGYEPRRYFVIGIDPASKLDPIVEESDLIVMFCPRTGALSVASGEFIRRCVLRC